MRLSLRICSALAAAAALGCGQAAAVRTSADVVMANTVRVARPFDFDGNGTQELAIGGNKRLIVYEYRRAGLTDPRVIRIRRFDDLEQASLGPLASGDLDKDGFADLVMGSPDDSLTFDPARDGSILVLKGSRDGLTTRGSYLVRGPIGRHGFGMGLAVADLDDDGWLDAAVGAPDPYRSPEPSTAAVIVLHGGPGALSIDRSTQLTPSSPGQSWFGYQLETGDVNGDGSTDLVDALGSWAPGPFREAATAIAFGAGGTLAVGDVTADGVDDIVVGHMRDAGAITVHPGTPSGPGTGVSYTQDSPGFPGHAEPYDRFGFSVGLLEGPDGRVDLLVGSREENVGGTVDVLSTAPSGLASRGALRLSEDRVGVPGRSRGHEHFGLILQALDLNGRGRPELIVLTRKRIPASVTGERVGYELLRLIFFEPMRDGAVWRLRDQDVPDGWG